MNLDIFINNFLIEKIDLEEVKRYFLTIELISSILDSYNINYCFIGTTSLIFHYQKINRIPNDIDILVQRNEHKNLINIFDNNNILRDRTPWQYEFLRSFWLINNFKIDVWASYAKSTNKGYFKDVVGVGLLGENLLTKTIENKNIKYQDPRIVLNLKKINGSEKAISDIRYFTN